MHTRTAVCRKGSAAGAASWRCGSGTPRLQGRAPPPPSPCLC
jgi:hypothetical protein